MFKSVISVAGKPFVTETLAKQAVFLRKNILFLPFLLFRSTTITLSLMFFLGSFWRWKFLRKVINYAWHIKNSLIAKGSILHIYVVNCVYRRLLTLACLLICMAVTTKRPTTINCFHVSTVSLLRAICTIFSLSSFLWVNFR